MGKIKKREWLVAGLLSFFLPGIGQIYNGELKKGIGFIFLFPFLVSVVAYVLACFHVFLWIVALACVLISLVAAAEAAWRALKTPDDFELKAFNRWWFYVLFSLLVFVPNIIARSFLVEGFQIPSQSMVPNLLMKDALMVDKLSMGSRLPVVNWKFPGLFKPERNDIIIFVHPGWVSPGLGQELMSLMTGNIIHPDNTFDLPKNIVKRIVGMPGDKLLMTNKVLSINRLTVKMDKIRVVPEAVYERGKKQGTVDFELLNEYYGDKENIIQQLQSTNHFNREEAYNFPEISVPRKGDFITIKDKNEFYKNLLIVLIERESGRKFTVSGGKYLLGGKEFVDWKVRNNYYFCMGDNRDLSEDSRFFGFVPDRNIIGRILFRYWPLGRSGYEINETANSVKKLKFN